MATVIWLLRRHQLTGRRLGFAKVGNELAADFIKKGWAQPAKGERLRAFDPHAPVITAEDPAPAPKPAPPAEPPPFNPDPEPPEQPPLPIERPAPQTETARRRGRPRKAA